MTRASALVAAAEDAGVEAVLGAEGRAEGRRADADPGDAPASEARLEHVVGELRLVAAVEGADADVGHADPERGAVVGRAAHRRWQAVEGGRGEAEGHRLAPTTRCSWSTRVPVIGPAASLSRKTARLAISSGVNSRPKGAAALAASSQPGPAARSWSVLLGRGQRPADVDAVDADAVEAVGVGGVLRHVGERGLAGGVDREVGGAAVDVDRGDVDDRPAFAAGAHRPDRALHQEERGAGVDGEEPVPGVGGRVEEGGSVGGAGGVGEEVEPPEAVERGGDEATGGVGIGEVGRDEGGGDAGGGEGGGGGLAGRGVAVGQKQAGGAGCGERVGDGAADALRRAGHERDLAVDADLQALVPPRNDVSVFGIMERKLRPVNRGQGRRGARRWRGRGPCRRRGRRRASGSRRNRTRRPRSSRRRAARAG